MSSSCKLVIAVSGAPGSGKSTLARRLSEHFGLRLTSSGAMFRSLASQKGLSLSEFSKIAEVDPSIDRLVDEAAIVEASKGCVVIDAHIAGWILKDLAHLRIYLTAPVDVRARRIAERDSKNYEEALHELITREESEARRFSRYYGIDIKDLSVFDLIINTARFNADEVFEISRKAVELITGGKI
ncbi:MAG: AAA family ATPase [Zestosphaera sp.]